jgi:hypothetical protein
VIAFLPAQVEAVEQAIADDDAQLVREVRNKGVDHSDSRAFGYQSVHVLVSPAPQLGAPDPPKDYRVPRVEIQLRTQLQHVWAELEHASRYKGAAGSRVSRKFDRAAALIEMVDELLQEIDDAAAAGERREPAPPVPAVDGSAAVDAPDRLVGNRLTARAMRSFLAEAFPQAPPSRGAGSEEWIRRHALESGFDTVEALRDAVRSVDVEAIDRTLAHDGLARKFLTERERAALGRLDADGMRRRVLTLWTCKEAMSKATGDALSAPFSRLDVDLRDGPRLVDGPAPYEPSRFALRSAAVPTGHIGTVALWRPADGNAVRR